LTGQVWEDVEPYRGITRESRFQLGAVGQLGPQLTLDRLDRRQSLLEQIERFRRTADAPAGRAAIDRHRAMAYNLLGSQRRREAFDLGLESDDTRNLYGMTLFGQATLTARRLVEAGGRFITVFWDEFGLAGTGWDTHWDHFPRMKDELLPGLDVTLSGLLLDLSPARHRPGHDAHRSARPPDGTGTGGRGHCRNPGVKRTRRPVNHPPGTIALDSASIFPDNCQ
jgi:Protein of unknown function (DUF1501)